MADSVNEGETDLHCRQFNDSLAIHKTQVEDVFRVVRSAVNAEMAFPCLECFITGVCPSREAS